MSPAKKTDTKPAAPKANAVVPYEEFRGELQARAQEIAQLLPSTITREQFENAAIIAVKQTPELLSCDRRSLHKAVTTAARDGLMPDGREGVILPRKEKISKKGQPDQWVLAACWQAMVYGIRKRARELDGIIVDAQVVYSGDKFKRVQGDDPRIEHEPAQLGTAKGKRIGAYAIFKRGGEILHREVMDEQQIEAVHAISRQPDGLMWSKFTDEAWRKTVVRRGSKTLPCSDKLRAVLEGDDDLYDVGGGERDPDPALEPPPAPPRRSLVAEATPAGAHSTTAATTTEASQPQETAQAEDAEVVDAPFVDPGKYVADVEGEMAAAGDIKSLNEVLESHREVAHRLSPDHQAAVDGAYRAHSKRIATATKGKKPAGAAAGLLPL